MPNPQTFVLSKSDGWLPLEPFPVRPGAKLFVSRAPDSEAIRVQYFKNDRTAEFAGVAWMGPETEGPPGHCHGGSQATLLDEVMGGICWSSGHQVLAAKLEVNFRQPLPLRTNLLAKAQIERVEGKKVFVRGRLEGEGGVIYSEATGLFVKIDAQKFIKAKPEG